MQEDITKEEWIKRCAERYVKVAAVVPKQAMEMAEAIFDDEQNGLTQMNLPIVQFDQGPEEAADTDMSYLEDD